VRVAIVDTGVDETHPDFAGRVVAKVDYGDAPVLGEPIDSGGHGTHVAGIVGGAAANLPAVGRVKDSGGFLYGLGMAPGVQLIDQNFLATTDLSSSGGFQALSRDSVRNGAVVWNASWHSGEGTGSGYIANARVLDTAVRDADWETADSQPLTMVFSAGNAGAGGAMTITSPKEAKNLITVGSSLSSRAGNINSISSSSSRGPARDGRILPTVVAPGASVVSARAHIPGGSCNTPLADGFGLYASCSGTSMAAPHVTGSVALITEWWRRANGGATPSPAMNKALLINTATDMGAADIPNKDEGWGRINLGSLFHPSAKRIYLDQSLVLDDLAQGITYQVAPADPSRPLKVTIVWTDAPGEAGANPALVNDLDLSVVASDGTTYRGNAFSDGVSFAGGEADRLNNLESVFVQNPSGTYEVSVSAFNLPGDGVPGVGDQTDQDFALVISNAVAAG
jgi:subtilisin family serine protease